MRLGRWLVVAMSLLLAAHGAPARAQDPNRAGLVVRDADGSVATYCVRFTEPSITGLELLTRAGLRPVAEVGGLGSAVCAIDGRGCAYPSQPCFCQCQGASCAYWNYFHLIDGAWRYSPLGSASTTVTDGAVEGWSWGDTIAPPVYSIDVICAASAVQPTVQPMGSAAPEPAAQSTSEPIREPAVTVAAEPTRESTSIPAPPTPEPTHQPISPSASSPTLEPASPSSQPTDLGSVAAFAVAILALGGWLIASRARR